MTKRQPWERQKGETSQAYEAFRTYMEMGAKRATRKVARKLGKSDTLISRWSSKHSWVKRVEAWENYEANQWTKERVELRQKAEQRIAMNIVQAQQRLLATMINRTDWDQMRASEWSRMFEVTARAAEEFLPKMSNDGVESGDSLNLSPEQARDGLRAAMREAKRRLDDGS